MSGKFAQEYLSLTQLVLSQVAIFQFKDFAYQRGTMCASATL